MLTQIFGEQTKGIIDEMICEIDHIWTADMKSSEAMIPAVVNTIFAILYFRIPHNTLCLPPKFCINYCFQMLLGTLHIPKSI